MKRRKQKAKPTRNSLQSNAAEKPTMKRKMNRRDFLSNSAFYTVGIAAIGGSGLYFGNSFILSAKESDLSTIGNGTPAIVQIHDPNCPTCNALRCEAREATCSFEEGVLQFRVASLQTPEGQELAAQHGVGKITLLLLDGNGKMRVAIPGMNTAENLKPVFQRHVKRYGRKEHNT